MEVTIKNHSSRILLERADNGVILYDVGEDNTVDSKILYEIYFKDGIIDFQNMGIFILEVMEALKIPTQESESNSILVISIEKLDPSLPDKEEKD